MVLAEYQNDNRPFVEEARRLHSLVDDAYSLLANVSGGDWRKQSEAWRTYAIAWRNRYFEGQE